MRRARTIVRSRLFAVALTALVVGAGGGAFAATNPFAGPSGEIRACIAGRDLLEPVAGLVAPVTQTVVRAGTMRVIKPGEACDDGETPLTFNQTGPPGPAASPQDLLPKVYATRNKRPTKVTSTTTTVAAESLPAGNYLVRGSVELQTVANLKMPEIFDCSFVDPTGKVIAASTRVATFPAGQTSRQDVTLPLFALITGLPAGKLTMACRARPPSAVRPNAIGARAHQAISTNPIKACSPGLLYDANGLTCNYAGLTTADGPEFDAEPTQ